MNETLHVFNVNKIALKLNASQYLNGVFIQKCICHIIILNIITIVAEVNFSSISGPNFTFLQQMSERFREPAMEF